MLSKNDVLDLWISVDAAAGGLGYVSLPAEVVRELLLAWERDHARAEPSENLDLIKFYGY